MPLKEECGIFGVYGINEAARYVYLGLNFLQHRGQESCGIVSSDNENFYKQLGMGKVVDFFTEQKLNYLQGYHAIGHVRYSTTGSSTLSNAQPITGSSVFGPIAIAHNGNITNSLTIRESLLKKGKLFYSSSDSEVILHLICECAKEFYSEEKFKGMDYFYCLINSVKKALSLLEGAYSILIMTKDIILAARDPLGFRPLSLGKIGNTIDLASSSLFFSSEDSAFQIVEADKVRDINPNEIFAIYGNQIFNFNIIDNCSCKTKQCVFELIYFAKPSSVVFNKSVYDFRYKIGENLAKEHPVPADYVVPVPDSGIISAIGYSNYSKIPLGLGLIRSHYIGRTFIEPSQKIRDFGVKLKFIPVKEILNNKRIILIDDSLVRGTTAKKIVKMLRKAGAKEIHLRIASPPVKYPCFYGIDFSTYEELLANKLHDLESIAKYIEVDSIGYVSIKGLFDNTGICEDMFCKACFDNEYPYKIDNFKKGGLEYGIKEYEFY